MIKSTPTPSVKQGLALLPDPLPPIVFNPGSALAAANSADHYVNPLSKLDERVKRAEDLILGSMAILLFLPLMLIVALLIRLDSAGPIVFRQTRTGRNRLPIVVYKFRSMTSTSDHKFHQAVESDPRITRVGAFIRRTSLDELPQLFNVINGSMSLVGPRPHPLKLDEDFRHVIPSLPERYSVKPGITGLAQIRGYRGETQALISMVTRIDLDRQYIQNWSLFKDIWILMQTAIKGWTHKNAY